MALVALAAELTLLAWLVGVQLWEWANAGHGVVGRQRNRMATSAAARPVLVGRHSVAPGMGVVSWLGMTDWIFDGGMPRGVRASMRKHES